MGASRADHPTESAARVMAAATAAAAAVPLKASGAARRVGIARLLWLAMPTAWNASSAGLVIVSNRGPVEMRRSGDQVELGRAKGGLATGLAAALKHSVGTQPPSGPGPTLTWVCAALGAEERSIVSAGKAPSSHEGVKLAIALPSEDDYSMAYELVSNSVLWFAYHDLFDKARQPVIDGRFARAWEAYRSTNRVFAQTAAAHSQPNSTVLVQDYHLHLVGRFLKEARPDLRVVHFVHTPFCEPSGLATLPDRAARELLESIAFYDAVGFHSERWCRAFLSCCDAYGVAPPPTFAAPLGVDASELEATAASAEVAKEADRIRQAVGERRLVVRIDRMEPSKNILRGFLAFERLLEARTDLHGTVSFLALTYPSRESLAQYRTYRAEIETLARRLNARFARGSGQGGSEVGGVLQGGIGLDAAASDPLSWRPVILEVEDRYSRSVAAMSLYDVLLVNPVRDGLNLVAKEGPIANRNDGVLVLSREAGVWDELSGVAVGVNPFDLSETAGAIEEALGMDHRARSSRAAALRSAARLTTPESWLTAQIEAASKVPGRRPAR